MAGISSIASLSETLYYQYLINNNSTSTMLNAINGESDQASSGAASMLQAINTGVSSGSLSNLTGIDSLGSNEISDLFGTSGGLDFSSILETYLKAEQTESANLAESLSNVLEEAAQTEDTGSLSYQTVQELYAYFAEKTSSAAASLGSGGMASTSASANASSAGMIGSDMDSELDFDMLEQDIESGLEATLPYTGIPL